MFLPIGLPSISNLSFCTAFTQALPSLMSTAPAVVSRAKLAIRPHRMRCMVVISSVGFAAGLDFGDFAAFLFLYERTDLQFGVEAKQLADMPIGHLLLLAGDEQHGG